MLSFPSRLFLSLFLRGISAPFLTRDLGNATANQRWWWGCDNASPPQGHCQGANQYNITPSIEYVRAAVDDAVASFGANRSAVVLIGFSRGAIACGYLGLHDDATAKLWAGKGLSKGGCLNAPGRRALYGPCALS